MKVFKVLLSAVCVYALFIFCHNQTKGFQVCKIYSPLPYDAQWEIQGEGVKLNSTFRFLGKGGQFYAFVSDDGKTVLKLFKMHNLRQYGFVYKLNFFPFLNNIKVRLLFK